MSAAITTKSGLKPQQLSKAIKTLAQYRFTQNDGAVAEQLNALKNTTIPDQLALALGSVIINPGITRVRMAARDLLVSHSESFLGYGISLAATYATGDMTWKMATLRAHARDFLPGHALLRLGEVILDNSAPSEVRRYAEALSNKNREASQKKGLLSLPNSIVDVGNCIKRLIAPSTSLLLDSSLARLRTQLPLLHNIILTKLAHDKGSRLHQTAHRTLKRRDKELYSLMFP